MKRLFEGGGYSDISVNDTAGGGIYSQMVVFISRLGTYQKKYDMYKLIFYMHSISLFKGIALLHPEALNLKFNKS